MAPDPTVTELIRSKIDALSDELLHLLYRSAYSTLMRESRDCSFLVTSPDGDLLSEGPTHYRFALRNLMANHAIAENDIFITNHPYESGVQHTPDLLVMVPVYFDGVLIGFSGTVAHKSDVGGSVVGSASSQSTEIYQEGLLLPIMKLGEFSESGFDLDDRILRIISTNVRNPDLYLGDMRAQIGVTRVGADRLRDLAQTFGVNGLLDGYRHILELGERLVRKSLAAWPDGNVTVEGFLDNDGVRLDQPVRYQLKVTKLDDEITFDLSGSDDQTLGPVNMHPAYMEGQIFGGLLSMIDPSAAYNDGMRRPVTVITRTGSVFDPRFPAPVGAAPVIRHRLRDLIHEALGHFNGERAVADGGGSGGTLALLYADDTRESTSRSMQYEVHLTATGASNGQDGCGGTGATGNVSPITPIEILESQFPVRISRFELIEDSGGPGEFRGGLSYRRQYDCLVPATLNRRADRGTFASNGIGGGGPGSLGKLIIDAGTDHEHEVAIAGLYHLDAGQSFMMEGSGAGGYGHPWRRSADSVARDVAVGYVSIESAERDYGVVLVSDGTVDHAKTEVLRDRMQSASVNSLHEES